MNLRSEGLDSPVPQDPPRKGHRDDTGLLNCSGEGCHLWHWQSPSLCPVPPVQGVAGTGAAFLVTVPVPDPKSPSEGLRGTRPAPAACETRGPSPPHLALVRATFSRRGSFRNPMPWCSLALTQERMMKSFSRPWNASTLAISTSCQGTQGHSQPAGHLQGPPAYTNRVEKHHEITPRSRGT